MTPDDIEAAAFWFYLWVVGAPDQVVALETALQDAGIPIEKFKKRAKLERLALMTAERFEPALKWIAEQRTQ